MRSTGHGYGHFRRALDARNVDATLAAAAGLPTVSLEDALEVCELLADKSDPRYEQAARRWLSRYTTERRPRLADLQIAAEALDTLESATECHMALKTLRELL